MGLLRRNKADPADSGPVAGFRKYEVAIDPNRSPSFKVEKDEQGQWYISLRGDIAMQFIAAAMAWATEDLGGEGHIETADGVTDPAVQWVQKYKDGGYPIAASILQEGVELHNTAITLIAADLEQEGRGS